MISELAALRLGALAGWRMWECAVGMRFPVRWDDDPAVFEGRPRLVPPGAPWRGYR